MEDRARYPLFVYGTSVIGEERSFSDVLIIETEQVTISENFTWYTLLVDNLKLPFCEKAEIKMPVSP